MSLYIQITSENTCKIIAANYLATVGEVYICIDGPGLDVTSEGLVVPAEVEDNGKKIQGNRNR